MIDPTLWYTFPNNVHMTISVWTTLLVPESQSVSYTPKKRDKNKNKNNAAWHVTFLIHDSCHSPISWTTVPWYQQPLASIICRFPPWRPTHDQHLRNTKTSAMTEKKITILFARLIWNCNQYGALHTLSVYQNFSFRSQRLPSLFPPISIVRYLVYILWK